MKIFVDFGRGGGGENDVREVELVERLGELRVTVDGAPMEVDYREIDRLGQVVLLHEGRSYAISIEGTENRVDVTLAGHSFVMELEDERERAALLAARAAAKGGGPVKAVMPGVVVQVLAPEGTAVSAGEPLLVLEAMKMQNEIAAPSDAVVQRVHVEAGQAVSAGDVLVTLKGHEE